MLQINFIFIELYVLLSKLNHYRKEQTIYLKTVVLCRGKSQYRMVNFTFVNFWYIPFNEINST